MLKSVDVAKYLHLFPFLLEWLTVNYLFVDLYHLLVHLMMNSRFESDHIMTVQNLVLYPKNIKNYFMQ